MAIVCRARLSWRLPARLSRWRCWRPEETSSGATPACMASWASLRKRSMPATSPDQLGGGQRAAARQREQLRRLAPHERLDLALEPVGLAGQLAAVTDEFAGDPHLHGLLAAGQPPPEP